MLSIIEIIEVRSPQFSTCTRLSNLIEVAKLLTGTNFGDNYNLAVALRVVHWLTKETMQGGTLDVDSGFGNSGSISEKHEGQLGISFSGGASNEKLHFKYGDLVTTSYGLELINLMKSCCITIRNRMVDE
jgi:hypothetical protein